MNLVSLNELGSDCLTNEEETLWTTMKVQNSFFYFCNLPLGNTFV